MHLSECTLSVFYSCRASLIYNFLRTTVLYNRHVHRHGAVTLSKSCMFLRFSSLSQRRREACARRADCGSNQDSWIFVTAHVRFVRIAGVQAAESIPACRSNIMACVLHHYIVPRIGRGISCNAASNRWRGRSSTANRLSTTVVTMLQWPPSHWSLVRRYQFGCCGADYHPWMPSRRAWVIIQCTHDLRVQHVVMEFDQAQMDDTDPSSNSTSECGS